MKKSIRIIIPIIIITCIVAGGFGLYILYNNNQKNHATAMSIEDQIRLGKAIDNMTTLINSQNTSQSQYQTLAEEFKTVEGLLKVDENNNYNTKMNLTIAKNDVVISKYNKEVCALLSNYTNLKNIYNKLNNASINPIQQEITTLLNQVQALKNSNNLKSLKEIYNTNKNLSKSFLINPSDINNNISTLINNIENLNSNIQQTKPNNDYPILYTLYDTTISGIVANTNVTLNFVNSNYTQGRPTLTGTEQYQGDSTDTFDVVVTSNNNGKITINESCNGVPTGVYNLISENEKLLGTFTNLSNNKESNALFTYRTTY